MNNRNQLYAEMIYLKDQSEQLIQQVESYLESYSSAKTTEKVLQKKLKLLDSQLNQLTDLLGRINKEIPDFNLFDAKFRSVADELNGKVSSLENIKTQIQGKLENLQFIQQGKIEPAGRMADIKNNLQTNLNQARDPNSLTPPKVPVADLTQEIVAVNTSIQQLIEHLDKADATAVMLPYSENKRAMRNAIRETIEILQNTASTLAPVDAITPEVLASAKDNLAQQKTRALEIVRSLRNLSPSNQPQPQVESAETIALKARLAQMGSTIRALARETQALPQKINTAPVPDSLKQHATAEHRLHLKNIQDIERIFKSFNFGTNPPTLAEVEALDYRITDFTTNLNTTNRMIDPALRHAQQQRKSTAINPDHNLAIVAHIEKARATDTRILNVKNWMNDPTFFIVPDDYKNEQIAALDAIITPLSWHIANANQLKTDKTADVTPLTQQLDRWNDQIDAVIQGIQQKRAQELAAPRQYVEQELQKLTQRANANAAWINQIENWIDDSNLSDQEKLTRHAELDDFVDALQEVRDGIANTLNDVNEEDSDTINDLYELISNLENDEQAWLREAEQAVNAANPPAQVNPGADLEDLKQHTRDYLATIPTWAPWANGIASFDNTARTNLLNDLDNLHQQLQVLAPQLDTVDTTDQHAVADVVNRFNNIDTQLHAIYDQIMQAENDANMLVDNQAALDTLQDILNQTNNAGVHHQWVRESNTWVRDSALPDAEKQTHVANLNGLRDRLVHLHAQARTLQGQIEANAVADVDTAVNDVNNSLQAIIDDGTAWTAAVTNAMDAHYAAANVPPPPLPPRNDAIPVPADIAPEALTPRDLDADPLLAQEKYHIKNMIDSYVQRADYFERASQLALYSRDTVEFTNMRNAAIKMWQQLEAYQRLLNNYTPSSKFSPLNWIKGTDTSQNEELNLSEKEKTALLNKINPCVTKLQTLLTTSHLRSDARERVQATPNTVVRFARDFSVLRSQDPGVLDQQINNQIRTFLGLPADAVNAAMTQAVAISSMAPGEVKHTAFAPDPSEACVNKYVMPKEGGGSMSLVSVQKTNADGNYLTMVYQRVDEKIDSSMSWHLGYRLPNNGVLKDAIKLVDDHMRANPNANGRIHFEPSETASPILMQAIALYCEYKNYKYNESIADLSASQISGVKKLFNENKNEFFPPSVPELNALQEPQKGASEVAKHTPSKEEIQQQETDSTNKWNTIHRPH